MGHGHHSFGRSRLKETETAEQMYKSGAFVSKVAPFQHYTLRQYAKLVMSLGVYASNAGKTCNLTDEGEQRHRNKNKKE
jgi:hypothetical protein